MAKLKLKQAPEGGAGWWLVLDDTKSLPKGCEDEIYLGQNGISCLAKKFDGAEVKPRKELRY